MQLVSPMQRVSVLVSVSRKTWFESHCWLGRSKCQPLQNWPINFILPSGSVGRELLFVSSQLTFLLMRSMQFLRGTMTTLNNVRGFVFPSLKLRNITPRISLLSYHSEKVWLYDPFCLFLFADVSWNERITSYLSSNHFIYLVLMDYNSEKC